MIGLTRYLAVLGRPRRPRECHLAGCVFNGQPEFVARSRTDSLGRMAISMNTRVPFCFCSDAYLTPDQSGDRWREDLCVGSRADRHPRSASSYFELLRRNSPGRTSFDGPGAFGKSLVYSARNLGKDSDQFKKLGIEPLAFADNNSSCGRNCSMAFSHVSAGSRRSSMGGVPSL